MPAFSPTSIREKLLTHVTPEPCKHDRARTKQAPSFLHGGPPNSLHTATSTPSRRLEQENVDHRRRRFSDSRRVEVSRPKNSARHRHRNLGLGAASGGAR